MNSNNIIKDERLDTIAFTLQELSRFINPSMLKGLIKNILAIDNELQKMKEENDD